MKFSVECQRDVRNFRSAMKFSGRSISSSSIFRRAMKPRHGAFVALGYRELALPARR
jgi:hypothetical protein